MIPVLYSFYDADGKVLGSLHELELAVCPRSGEVITFPEQGGNGERQSFIVNHLTHVIHRKANGELLQIVDISVRALV